MDYPLRHYGRDGLDVCADAFESIQAIPIARALREIRYADEQLDEESAEAAQSLISSRTGYDYSSIQKWVESHFHESS
ncbi:MAG: hypothetical protein SFY80_16780 [Verrucomicrobiota bacterium]|nr:hypothetical protein [Verrucomicrobiota bacterium]